jgi:hypothetical protein
MKQIDPKQRIALSKFRALMSLNQVCYQTLLPVFDRHVVAHLSVYTLKGKVRALPSFKEAVNSSLYGSVSKLDYVTLPKRKPYAKLSRLPVRTFTGKSERVVQVAPPASGSGTERVGPGATWRERVQLCGNTRGRIVGWRCR